VSRIDGDRAVVALDRGTGPELVVKVDQPWMLKAVRRDPAHRFVAHD
jgi:hypothetical protein